MFNKYQSIIDGYIDGCANKTDIEGTLTSDGSEQFQLTLKPDVQRKISLLKKTWSQSKDNEPARIIAPILYSKVKPIYYVIIMDDIKNFISNEDYKNCIENHNHNKDVEESDLNLHTWLEVACLSGSTEIAECLLHNLSKNYIDCVYLFSYVATSPNRDWAIEIAKSLKSNNIKKIPSEVYSYVEDLEIIESIEGVFEDTKGPSNYRPGALILK